MPQEKSREKDLRRSLFRRRLNRDRKRAMRMAIRAALDAAARGNEEELDKALRNAQRAIDLARQKGPLHKRTAARRKSQLMRRIAALQSKGV
ncbi:MAG: 30S ribosomal protein S20 [Armatimonadetes bacterium]|nr:30S ribosomal protein S20 [Armatimonadota bacterium]